MILQPDPPVHLTYCMNIHPGEHWGDQLSAIQDKAAVLRQMIKPDDWFGLGLRLSGQAVAGLSIAAGTVVVVTAVGTGWVLSTASRAIAFVPNEIGNALLYNERVTR